MRPSDENQHRSKRPNLFSSSRRSGGGDGNILARLEAGRPGRSGGASSRPHPAVLGGAGVVIVGLVATLAVLAGGNGGQETQRRMQVSAPAVAAVNVPAPLPELRPAVIIEETAAADPVPAMVTLAAAEPAPAASVEPMRAIEPPKPRRPAATPEPVRARPKFQLAANRPAPAKPPRRAAATSSEVDPDVAILTVILSQTARHSNQTTLDGECGSSRARPCPSTQF